MYFLRLRSTKNPDEKADMGIQTFTYAIMPHTGKNTLISFLSKSCIRGPPFNFQGGGGGGWNFLRTNYLFQPGLLHVYKEQLLNLIIYFMQSLPEIIYFKK